MDKRLKGNGLFMPLELIREYLVRCDVKTVLVSKSVSKGFNGVIASPDFVEEHYKHSRKRLLVHLSLATRNPAMAGRARFVLYRNEGFKGFTMPSQLQFRLEQYGTDYKEWRIFKVVNGVFCIFRVEMDSVEQIVLVNPALKQFKVMPRLFFSLKRGRVRRKLAAFGLNPVTGHLKLVMFEYFNKWNGSTGKKYCRVYVCSTTDVSWSLVSDEEDAVLSRGTEIDYIKSDAYLDGVYYWIYRSRSDVVQVAAFDMGSNELRIINVRGCYKDAKKLLRLCGESGSLTLLRVDRDDESIEIWTMTHEHSWIRGVTLGPIQDIYDVLFVWSKDEMLIQTSEVDVHATNQVSPFLAQPTTVEVRRTWLYNVSTRRLTKLIRAHQSCIAGGEGICESRTQFYTYKESLVPLPGAEMWIPSSSRCIALFTN